MVTITKSMKIVGDPNLVVYSAEGDYADADLILCADRKNPDLPSAQLQAQYIQYGPIVYQFNSPEELGAAIFAIDAASTHDAVLLYKEDQTRKAARLTGTLEPSDPVAAPDSNADTVPENLPNDQEPDTQFFQEEAATNTASTTPELPVIEAGDPEVLGTTTPDVVVDPPALEASTTPPVEPAVIDAGNISSTTPEALPVIEIPTPQATESATTTP